MVIGVTIRGDIPLLQIWQMAASSAMIDSGVSRAITACKKVMRSIVIDSLPIFLGSNNDTQCLFSDLIREHTTFAL